MPTPLEIKQKNRFRLLHALYDETDGLPERHLIDIRELGKGLEMSADESLDTFEYLKNEGLAKWMALGGVGTITHWGVKEVEDALEHRPSAHFPANIIILANSPNASVNTGVLNTQTTFDQRYQSVTTQYNAARDVNFGEIKSKSDVIAHLDMVKAELQKIAQAGQISELTESRAKTDILEAIDELKQHQPSREKTGKLIARAKGWIENASAAGNIVGMLTSAHGWVMAHLPS